jgi:hypothetical protein
VKMLLEPLVQQELKDLTDGITLENEMMIRQQRAREGMTISNRLSPISGEPSRTEVISICTYPLTGGYKTQIGQRGAPSSAVE